MKKTNALSKVKLILGIVFGMVGMLIVVIGIFKYIRDTEFLKTAQVTTGYVTDCDSYRSNKKTRYEISIQYEVDGKIYSTRESGYTSPKRIGEEITVYYNPANPGETGSGDSVGGIVAMGIGGVFFVVGVVIIIFDISSNIKTRKLIAEGTEYLGTITNVELVTNVRINGRHPYKAEIQVVNPVNGETYIYSSNSYTTDISYMMGQCVTVYIDNNDRSKKYIDMDGAIESYNKALADLSIQDYR